MNQAWLNGDQGAVLLVAVVILMLLSVLGTTMIEIGMMEFRSSHNDFEAQQAQQAADAGIEWGMENICLELEQPANLIRETLPTLLSCGNTGVALASNGELCGARIGNVVEKVNQLGEPNWCSYEFTSTGTFRSARKAVTVQVIYYYTGGYQYENIEGSLSFIPRQYLNRGRIIAYHISF
jgi:Tfp pilus assembly protein PilX